MFLAIVFSLSLLSEAKTVDKVSIKNKNSAPSVEQNSIIENSEASDSLAKYFRENNCTSILKYFKDRDSLSLKPLELALLAYCEPIGKDPEKMFAYAEKKDPKDDVILLLHGRYRWKKYKVSVSEVWEKLLNQTKNEDLQDLAQQYLDGKGAQAEANLGGKENQTSFFQLGVIHESNPEQLPKSDSSIGKNGSDGALWNLTLVRRSDYEFGFVDWNTVFSGTQYSTAPAANLALIDFSPQVSLQSSIEQFFIIRPSGSAFTLDGRSFYSRLGLSLGELWTYPNLDFSVLMTLAGDRYYALGTEAQSGTHYLIEQKTNYRYMSSIFSLTLGWDKGNASEDVSATGQVTPYTNTTGFVSFSYQWGHQKLGLGFNSSLSVRGDEFETIYRDSANLLQTKKRQDITYNLGPWISWKWTEHLTGIVFYSLNQVKSNMTEAELFDRNIDNSVAGIILKAGF